MQQRVSVNGYLQTNHCTNYGAAHTFSGGYFALATNSGDHIRNTFAVVPEIGPDVAERLTSQATVCFGYSFLCEQRRALIQLRERNLMMTRCVPVFHLDALRTRILGK